MFSQLGPLFKTTLRQAEHTDARLEIRREEKENQGKKQEFEDKSEDTGALWEDSMAVSVEALRTFLVEFLKSRGDELLPQEAAHSAQAQAGYMPETRPPASNVAARAVKAYTSMQTQNYGPPPALPEPGAAEEDVDLVSLLKADELRTIHVLIQELDLFSRRGIQTLTIDKADTFLESLVQAVRLEKTKF